MASPSEAEAGTSAKKPAPVPTASTSTVPPPRVYNAIYSAVQVYECMVRGIAVMRRRVDSYVNATQILKVAGIDKGRRTKILEKEILPGKHEIVQGGYGKYQGTWIPLERGREIANQFGVAPLLAPLFDYIPPTPSVAHRMPGNAPNTVPRPFYSPQGMASPHFGSPSGLPFHGMSSPHLGPPRSPFLPQAYPPLLSSSTTPKGGIPRTGSLGGAPPQLHTAYLYPGSPNPYTSPRPLVNSPALKRSREDSVGIAKKDALDTRLSIGGPPKSPVVDGVKQPPLKRPRTDAPTPANPPSKPPSQQGKKPADAPTSKNASSSSKIENEQATAGAVTLKSSRHRSIIASISHDAAAASILQQLKDGVLSGGVDTILDEQGHTALHFAASLSRLELVQLLIDNGADINHGNNAGETPLMRTVLSAVSFEAQTFPPILKHLAESIRMIDASSRTVLHHIALVAGVKQRSSAAQYYMECILEYVALNQKGEDTLESLVNMRDIHGDTALNLAARVGNRTLVRNLLDVGADAQSSNNLGLRPSDFGIMDENIPTEPSRPIVVARITPVEPHSIQKGRDVITELTSMVETLGTDFSAAIQSKQEQFELVQIQLRSVTHDLSLHRRTVREVQNQSIGVENMKLRIRNLETALQDRGTFSWSATAAGPPDMTSSPNKAGKMNGFVTVKMEAVSDTTPPDVPMALDGETEDAGGGDARSTPPTLLSLDTPSTSTPTPDDPFAEVALPTGDTLECLLQLRKIKAWQAKMDGILALRSANLKERSAEKELQCKRIVSLCTGTAMDKVDEMLDTLLTAIESESSSPEIERIASFMQKAGGRPPAT